MNIEAVGYKVVVKPDKKKTEDGGVIIQETAREKITKGTVVAYGSGACDRSGKPLPFPVDIGDRVLFDWLKGNMVHDNDEDYLILDVDNIAAKL